MNTTRRGNWAVPQMVPVTLYLLTAVAIVLGEGTVSVAFAESSNASAESSPTESSANSSSTGGTGTSHEKSGDTKTNNSETNAAEEELLAPWNEMNGKFRSSYANARLAKLAKQGPLIVMRDDSLVLLHSGKRQEANVIPSRYTLLKSVSHIPLTIFVLLEDRQDTAISDELAELLKQFRSSYEKAASNLGSWKLSEKTLQRQKKIVSDCNEFIDNSLKNRSVTDDQLLAFCRAMGPLVLENAYEAVSAQLAAIDKQVSVWQKEISQDEWKRLHVAVMSSHMPREQNAVMQYFHKYLGQKKEGENLIYGEGRSEEQYAQELVGTHIIDRAIAVYFFKDPWRMHRDLLSDGAARHLKKNSPIKMKMKK